MEIQQGYSYHIKDEFFDLVQDKYLMSNKEQENYRPHYYAIQDRKNPKIYWMVPISSQADKYKGIIDVPDFYHRPTVDLLTCPPVEQFVVR